MIRYTNTSAAPSGIKNPYRMLSVVTPAVDDVGVVFAQGADTFDDRDVDNGEHDEADNRKIPLPVVRRPSVTAAIGLKVRFVSGITERRIGAAVVHRVDAVL